MRREVIGNGEMNTVHGYSASDTMSDAWRQAIGALT
jgi:hypothetical protein